MENHEKLDDIAGKIEALLFVSSGLVSIYQLSNVLEISERDVEKRLVDLELHYKTAGHGIRIMRMKNRVQLTTAAALGKTVEAYLGLQESSTLSQAALETLAIVAYKQPVTRPEVDSIRGVNSDGVMRTLLTKGVIEELGRAETPGRPIYYGTSPEFLQYFGLETLDSLPVIDFDALEEIANGNGTKEVLKT